MWCSAASKGLNLHVKISLTGLDLMPVFCPLPHQFNWVASSGVKTLPHTRHTVLLTEFPPVMDSFAICNENRAFKR